MTAPPLKQVPDLFSTDEEDIESNALVLAIEKFEKMAAEHSLSANLDIQRAYLYWEWGSAYLSLAKKSGEISDYQKGLDLLIQASNHFGIDHPAFYLTLGEAWMRYGHYLGNPDHLKEAFHYLEKTISLAEWQPHIFHPAWRLYGLCSKYLFELTHKKEDFERAVQTLQEAILTAPQYTDLWLEWGELYLRAGWIARNVFLTQKALELFTSQKAEACDPLRLSALLGESLVVLGLLLEDFTFLRDGRQRILDTLEIAPDYTPLEHAAGMAELCFGLYFSEEMHFLLAIEHFQKRIEGDSGAIESLYGLFRAFFHLGELIEDLAAIKKATHILAHTSFLRPASYFLINEWGEALLKQNQFESREEAQKTIESAIALFEKSFQLYETYEITYNLGCAYDLLGNLTFDLEPHQKAVHYLLHTYQIDPSFRHVTYQLALALTHEGELSGTIESLYQARTLFETLIQYGESDGEIWTDFGYLLLMLSTWVDPTIDPDQILLLRAEAEKKLVKGIEEGITECYYHLACLYSLAELPEASLKNLHMSAEHDVLPSLDILEEDEWLSNVRKTEEFKKFLQSMNL